MGAYDLSFNNMISVVLFKQAAFFTSSEPSKIDNEKYPGDHGRIARSKMY
jgi:hypothetical protein